MLTDPYRSHSPGYAAARRADPRIAARIRRALANCRSVVNVGAGTGSYEPSDLDVIAVEPSLSMVRQRLPGSAPVIQSRAEALPLRNDSVDAALVILTMHHWHDQAQGLRECMRVARQCVVLLIFDPVIGSGFWLTDEYFPEIQESDHRSFPTREQLGEWLGTHDVETIPVPADCSDGFLGAYWRRPWAYLDAQVRAGMSTFGKIQRLQEGLARLRCDLESGAWERRYGHLLKLDELDVGYRLAVRQCGAR